MPKPRIYCWSPLRVINGLNELRVSVTKKGHVLRTELSPLRNVYAANEKLPHDMMRIGLNYIFLMTDMQAMMAVSENRAVPWYTAGINCACLDCTLVLRSVTC